MEANSDYLPDPQLRLFNGALGWNNNIVTEPIINKLVVREIPRREEVVRKAGDLVLRNPPELGWYIYNPDIAQPGDW